MQQRAKVAKGASSRRAGVSKPEKTQRVKPRMVLAGLTGFMGFALAWELVARLSGLGEETFPTATTILVAMLSLLVDVDFLWAVTQTVMAASIGLLIALGVGIPLGVVMGLSPTTYRATNALIETIRPVPAVALIPVALLVFGVGVEMKVFLVAFSVLWTILVNTIYAVRDIEPLLKDTGRCFGFTRAQTVRHIVVPYAAPFIYTGLRIGAVAALLITVAAELLAGGSGGLGQWLSRMQNAVTQNHMVYAGALLSGVLGVAINIALDKGERKLFAWHASVRGDSR